MASLYEVTNQIIGSPTATAGLRFYTNHSATETPGAGAVYALTLKQKVEGPPPMPFDDDPTGDFPAVYLERMGGAWPQAPTIEGNQYICAFICHIYVVVRVDNDERPKEEAQAMICKIVDNIAASTKIGLSHLTTVDWLGNDGDTDISHLFTTLHPRYAMASTRFAAKAVWG